MLRRILRSLTVRVSRSRDSVASIVQLWSFAEPYLAREVCRPYRDQAGKAGVFSGDFAADHSSMGCIPKREHFFQAYQMPTSQSGTRRTDSPLLIAGTPEDTSSRSSWTTRCCITMSIVSPDASRLTSRHAVPRHEIFKLATVHAAQGEGCLVRGEAGRLR